PTTLLLTPIQHTIPPPISQSVFISGFEIEVDSPDGSMPHVFSSSEINAQGAGGCARWGEATGTYAGRGLPAREDRYEQVSHGPAVHDRHFRRDRCRQLCPGRCRCRRKL